MKYRDAIARAASRLDKLQANSRELDAASRTLEYQIADWKEKAEASALSSEEALRQYRSAAAYGCHRRCINRTRRIYDLTVFASWKGL